MVTLWRRNFSHFLIQCPVSLVYYEFWSCSVTGRTKIFRSNRPIIKLFRSDQFFLAVSCLFVHLSETHGDSDNAWKRDKTMSVKNRCSAHLKEATFQITKVIPTLPSALPETNIATWKYAIPKSWNLHSTTKTIRENILGFSTGFLSLFFHQNGPPLSTPLWAVRPDCLAQVLLGFLQGTLKLLTWRRKLDWWTWQILQHLIGVLKIYTHTYVYIYIHISKHKGLWNKVNLMIFRKYDVTWWARLCPVLVWPWIRGAHFYSAIWAHASYDVAGQ